MFFKALFTGIVDDISPAQKKAMEANWNELTDKNKDDYLLVVEKQAAARRVSMFETATRSNYLLVVSAFVIAATVAMLIAISNNPVSELLLKISISMILLSTAIFAVAISAKSKVMKKPRKGGEIEPAEMLWKALRTQERAKDSDSSAEQRQRLFDESNKLHKRKIILVAERRAQWVATNLMVLGLLVMIAGVITF